MTISVLQETRLQTAGSGGTSGAFSSNVTAGSSIHVVVYASANPATAFAVSDNKGNTYTQRGAILNDANGHYMTHFTADGAAAGATTITVTPTGTTILTTAAWCREIGSTSGFDTHSEQAVSGASTFSAGSDVLSSLTATPSVAPGLISGMGTRSAGSALTMAAGTGFTQDTTPNAAEVTEHLRYTTTAAAAATFNASGAGSSDGIAFAAFFKESGGGGGPTNHNLSLMGVGS